jgi:hypothetical protein
MPASSGTYTVVRTNVSTTTAITTIQVATPANCAIDILRAWGGQSSSTTSAATACGLIKKTAAATVTSRTPDLLTDGMQASKCVGGTAATGITATVEGTDEANYKWNEGLNIVGNGCLYLPTPEEIIGVGPSEFIGLKHSVAPSGNWIHGINFREYAF